MIDRSYIQLRLVVSTVKRELGPEWLEKYAALVLLGPLPRLPPADR